MLEIRIVLSEPSGVVLFGNSRLEVKGAVYLYVHSLSTQSTLKDFYRLLQVCHTRLINVFDPFLMLSPPVPVIYGLAVNTDNL